MKHNSPYLNDKMHNSVPNTVKRISGNAHMLIALIEMTPHNPKPWPLDYLLVMIYSHGIASYCWAVAFFFALEKCCLYCTSE